MSLLTDSHPFSGDPSALGASKPSQDGRRFADPKRTVDDLISRALAYRTGPELKALFEFMRRFPHLAPYNAMLLHVQNPGIAYALRAPDWERRYRRRVKPAARPHVILWTMGPVAFVFDLGDTEPIDPSDDRVPPCVTNPFPASGEPPPGAMKALASSCLKIGIEVELRNYGTNLAGRAEQREGEAASFHIALNSNHSEAQQLGTLAHELGHIFCGHLGATEQGFWGERRTTPRDVQEFEAETVAYLVTDRMNLDIGSVSYLAGYLHSEAPLPNYSLDAVLKAVGKIEEMMSGRYRPKKAPASAAKPLATNYSAAAEHWAVNSVQKPSQVRTRRKASHPGHLITATAETPSASGVASASKSARPPAERDALEDLDEVLGALGEAEPAASHAPRRGGRTVGGRKPKLCASGRAYPPSPKIQFIDSRTASNENDRC
ncbi:MAG: hypothetical protein QOD99_2979 [Chthoniobacter sp.]|nr:hypothetical protein [Chthoniobacter sp.]